MNSPCVGCRRTYTAEKKKNGGCSRYRGENKKNESNKFARGVGGGGAGYILKVLTYVFFVLKNRPFGGGGVSGGVIEHGGEYPHDLVIAMKRLLCLLSCLHKPRQKLTAKVLEYPGRGPAVSTSVTVSN